MTPGSLEFIRTLDNREVATLIWLALFAAWALRKPAVRGATWLVVRAVLARPLLGVAAGATLYLLGAIICLVQLNAWTAGDLKATLLWALLAAPAMVYDAQAAKADLKLLWKSLADGLKISAFLECFAGLFVLPLVVELVLVPLAAVLTGLSVFAASNKESRDVKRLVDYLLGLMGLGLLAYAALRTLKGPFEVFTSGAREDFLVPLLLTVLFVPFTSLVAVSIAYEEIFSRLSFFISDSTLRSYTKWILVRTFGIDLRGLGHWWTKFVTDNPTSKEGILALTNRVKLGQSRRKSGDDASPSRRETQRADATVSVGNLAPAARKYFQHQEKAATSEDLEELERLRAVTCLGEPHEFCGHHAVIPTGEYKEDPRADYACWSRYEEIGSDEVGLANNVALYVDGTSANVLQAKLRLNVNQPASEEAARTRLLVYAERLAATAGIETLPPSIARSILRGEPRAWAGRARIVRLARIDWPTGRGYELCFVVSALSNLALVDEYQELADLSA